MKNKILAAFMACAVIMSFSGCGEDTENISDMNSMTQSTNSETESSSFESNASDLMASDSETSNTDKQEQLEKIPLTDEELEKFEIGVPLIEFFKSYEQAGNKFDFTDSIDDKQLYKVLSTLTQMVSKEDVDDYELISGEVWDESYCYFKPETAERLIQEYFLSSFKISSVDYTKLGYWDSEKKQFKIHVPNNDVYNVSTDTSYYYLKESGYKAGDYYYVNYVPLCNYPNAQKFHLPLPLLSPEHIPMSYITSEYFDIPRVRLKFINCPWKYDSGESRDRYFCVGFAPVDERPNWVKNARSLFESIDREKLEDMRNYPNSMQMGVGVMSGDLGKRMYIRYTSQMGSHNFTQVKSILTIGARGKNDVILYESSSNSAITGGGFIIGDTNPNPTPKEINTVEITIQDNFKGETYAYYNSSTRNPLGELLEEPIIKYTLNEKEISEEEYNSAEVVTYFANAEQLFYDTSNEDRIVFKCENSFENITLADFYEICRVITD